MRKRTRRLHLAVVVLSTALALVIVADASSKSEINVHTANTKSEIRVPSGKKRDKAAVENSEAVSKRKKKGISGQRPSSSSGTSASMRRIKKEFKDAVDMGIAYDWVNQRRIKRKRGPEQRIRKNRDGSFICLGPIPTNLRQWHFSFWGAGEFYSKGIYHGRIVLPKNYPLSPPSVQMWTPSGRFVPRTDICLSASSYHPESWTPQWSIQGLVNALRHHMLAAPMEIGGMDSTPNEKLECARLSLVWRTTWKVREAKITVDHELLRKEGILSEANCEEETNDIEDTPSAQMVEQDNTNIKPIEFPNEAVTAMPDLTIFYLVIYIYLKR